MTVSRTNFVGLKKKCNREGEVYKIYTNFFFLQHMELL